MSLGIVVNFVLAGLLVCGVLYLVGWPHRRRTLQAASRAAVDAAQCRALLEGLLAEQAPAEGTVTRLPTGRGGRARPNLN